jgi:hypothetical protein
MIKAYVWKIHHYVREIYYFGLSFLTFTRRQFFPKKGDNGSITRYQMEEFQAFEWLAKV